jgi:hypothetical protein
MIYIHTWEKNNTCAPQSFLTLRVHETENFSQVWINDLYSHLGKKQHLRATVIFDSARAWNRKFFPSLNKWFIHTWEKNDDMLTRHSHFWLFARAWNWKFFPSLNRNDLFTLGKKQWHAHATVIFDSLCVCVKPKIFVSQVWINHLFTLGKKQHAHAPQSFLTLCACAWNQNFCFPSQNKWFIFTLGKKNNDMLTRHSHFWLFVCVRETENFCFP